MHKINPFRADALEKVTGRAMYSGDTRLDGMLECVVCWPPVPSAKVLRIHTEAAEQAPGVYRIITRRDIHGPNKAAVFEPYDRPILVGEGEYIRFCGDAVALVVAETRDQAERARDMITVEYEALPADHQLADAKANGEHFFEKTVVKGDVAEGFAKSDVIVERKYFIPYIEHAYIEPEAGFVYRDNRDVINVCFGSQNLGRHHRMVCKSLDLPFSKVRLYGPYIGGAFGGKHSVSVQVYLTLLGSLLDRPVRLVFTREESIGRGCKKHQLSTNMKLGFSKEGKLMALQGYIDSPAGPYFGYSRNTMDFACRYLCGPYEIETIDIRGRLYHTTNIESGAFRGFGGADATMMVETMMDLAADKLNMDPLELRKCNWLTDETLPVQFPGAPWRNVSEKLSLQWVMDEAFAAAGPKPLPSGKNKRVGRGYSNGLPCFCIGNTPGYKGTGCELLMFLDGSISVKLGFPEAGQGMTGIATRITAQAMEIDEDKINVYLCDTHKTPKAGSLGFSQGTVSAGNAIIAAADKLKSRLADIAREYLHRDEPDICFRRGAFWLGDEKILDWSELADYCYYEGKNLSADGWTVPPDETDRHGVTPVCAVVDVEVDMDTGETKVLQVVSCLDIGKIIHYDGARGQMLGGALMALGAMQSEEFVMKDGAAATPSLSEYLIPTFMDIPDKNTAVFVENYGQDCPYGAKGIGEHALYAASPAFLNAVFDATGVMMTEVPVTPERLLKALGRLT